VFTANRADYSKLRPLIAAMDEDDELECFVVVMGSHLLDDYGNTHLEVITPLQKKRRYMCIYMYSMFATLIRWREMDGPSWLNYTPSWQVVALDRPLPPTSNEAEEVVLTASCESSCLRSSVWQVVTPPPWSKALVWHSPRSLTFSPG